MIKSKKFGLRGPKIIEISKFWPHIFSICDFFYLFRILYTPQKFFTIFFYELFVFPNILVHIFWKSCKNSGHGISFKIIFMFQILKNEVLSQITLIFRYLNWQNYEITDMNIYIFWNIWSWTLKKKRKKRLTGNSSGGLNFDPKFLRLVLQE